MTYEEALQETAKRINLKKLTHEPGVLEYYGLVKEALEKQIPKKPNHKVANINGFQKHRCQICGVPQIKNGRYCSSCGQRLDWSDIT